MVQRVDDCEQFPRAPAVAQCSECHNCPDRGMSVLSAILPDAGDAPLDIAGIQRRFIEGRGQELDQSSGWVLYRECFFGVVYVQLRHEVYRGFVDCIQ